MKREQPGAGRWVYEEVTRRITQLLESGVVPWRQAWRMEPPSNLATGTRYRGVNVMLLGAAGFSSPFWLTFRQVQSLGGHVKKGEHGLPVVFWKLLERQTEPDEATPRKGYIPVLRYYTVFNIQQCDGLDESLPQERSTAAFTPVESAEAVVAGMVRPPAICRGGRSPSYRPREDIILMPAPERFDPPAEYYSTLFHELVHATGHSSRLARPGVVDVQAFGSHQYSREELIAEIGAAFLCAQCGIAAATVENSAAYIQAWLGRLRAEPRLIVLAAAQAQKAADHILNAAEPTRSTLEACAPPGAEVSSLAEEPLRP